MGKSGRPEARWATLGSDFTVSGPGGLRYLHGGRHGSHTTNELCCNDTGGIWRAIFSSAFANQRAILCGPLLKTFNSPLSFIGRGGVTDGRPAATQANSNTQRMARREQWFSTCIDDTHSTSPNMTFTLTLTHKQTNQENNKKYK